MDQLTLTLTGNSSNLWSDYHPPIELEEDASYVIGLIDFTTYNSIPNITDKNNKLHLNKYCNEVTEDSFIFKSKDICIEIEPGSYELKDIITLLNSKLVEQDCPLTIKVDQKTMKSMLTWEVGRLNEFGVCTLNEVDFSQKGSIASVLGFSPRKIVAKSSRKIESDHLVNIHNVNIIRVECNLSGGSYINGKSSHTIHEFYPTVAPGYKIVEVPTNIIYLPVIGRTIHHLNIRVVDQDGDLVDFRGENITCRVYIRKT